MKFKFNTQRTVLLFFHGSWKKIPSDVTPNQIEVETKKVQIRKEGMPALHFFLAWACSVAVSKLSTLEVDALGRDASPAEVRMASKYSSCEEVKAAGACAHQLAQQHCKMSCSAAKAVHFVSAAAAKGCAVAHRRSPARTWSQARAASRIQPPCCCCCCAARRAAIALRVASGRPVGSISMLKTFRLWVWAS